MNKIQRNYVLKRLGILGLIAFVVVGFLALCFEWLWAIIIIFLGIAVYFIYCFALLIAFFVYKWRVMGATDEDEADLFHDHWYTIINNRFDEVICQLKNHYDKADFKGWYELDSIEYLEKIKKVKRPKILDI